MKPVQAIWVGAFAVLQWGCSANYYAISQTKGGQFGQQGGKIEQTLEPCRALAKDSEERTACVTYINGCEGGFHTVELQRDGKNIVATVYCMTDNPVVDQTTDGSDGTDPPPPVNPADPDDPGPLGTTSDDASTDDAMTND